ncbi:MAG: hypothetical protein R2733_14685 [Acidimicrobiales bacterium]
MTQTAGSGQPIESHPARRALPPEATTRRARRGLRLDQIVFLLSVALAAFVAVTTTASANGSDVIGASARPLATPTTVAGGSSTIPADALDAGVDGVSSWAGTDRGGLVRYETERTALLGGAALDRLDYDWEANLPGWRIDFIEGNDRIAGYTWSNEARIEVFVRPTASSADVARILAHELGHAVDVTLNTGDERSAWLAQRGATEVQWWPSSGAADFETGAGDFAECFAVLLVGADDYRSKVAPAPTAADLALIAQLAT